SVMIIKAAQYPFIRRRMDSVAAGGKLYQIFIEKDARFRPSQYNNFFDSLYTIFDLRDKARWLTFEFHSVGSRGIALYSWLPETVSQGFLQANLNSIHPSAETVEAEDYANFSRLRGYDIS